MSRNEQKTSKDREHSKRGFWIAGILVILILSGVIVILTQFNIETIQVTGNVHYTEEEIIQRVVGDEHWNNTLLLYLKNKIKPPEAIPFVQKVDVEFISRHVITITVYEKALAGCVEFMNEYMYFDKDGNKEIYAVGGGAIHFYEKENMCKLLLRNIFATDEIDVVLAKQTQIEAEEKLKSSLSLVEHNRAERVLKRAINMLDIKNENK